MTDCRLDLALHPDIPWSGQSFLFQPACRAPQEVRRGDGDDLQRLIAQEPVHELALHRRIVRLEDDEQRPVEEPSAIQHELVPLKQRRSEKQKDLHV